MAEAILMPKQGITVESCVITGWSKQVGDAVKVGEILFTYETDKAAFDVTAETDGTLLAVFFPDGEDIPVLTAVGVIGAPGEDFVLPSGAPPLSDGRAKASDTPSAGTSTPAVTPMPAGAPATAGTPIAAAHASPASGASAISPRAKGVAALLGVDATQATGSGPNGRVIERDVRALFAQPAAQTAHAAAASSPTPGAYTDERLSGVRKAIARSMMASLQNMAQLTLSSSFDATAIQACRKAFKASKDADIAGITLTDMVLFAVSRVLTRPSQRHFNAHLEGETMRLFSDVHLAFAVDTPRGLLVPVIRNAHALSLIQLSQEAKRLAAQCQNGGISPDLLAGGTFTVSNLGGLGIEHFTPVINPPQTGILGLNNITWRPKDAGGELYPAMGLSITFDHRAVDGAPAARFLQEVGGLLEGFAAALL